MSFVVFVVSLCFALAFFAVDLCAVCSWRSALRVPGGNLVDSLPPHFNLKFYMKLIEI